MGRIPMTMMIWFALLTAFGERDFETVITLGTTSPASGSHFHYMMAVASHQTLNRPAAILHCREVVDSFTEPPRRYQVVCNLILDDVATWKEKDLATTGRQMKEVVGRLDVAKGGPVTQAKQKKILDDLDDKIKELENPPKDPQASSASPNNTPKDNSQLPPGHFRSRTD